MFLPQKMFCRGAGSCLRIIRLLAAALIFGALLAGCGSMTRLAYNQSDDLLYWWLDSYVDFNGQQSARVRDELTALQKWHRSSQLPRYADFLKKLQPLASQDISEAQACALADEARALLMDISQQAEPGVLWLTASLTTTQIAHLQRKYDKNNEAYEREWRSLPADELRAKRIKQARERSELLYGKLGRQQVAVIAGDVDASVWDAHAAHTERLRRQADIVQTLGKIIADKPASAELQATMRALLDRSVNSPNASYRANQVAQWQEACASLAKVHNSTTPAQRARALETLKDYEASARVLATQKP